MVCFHRLIYVLGYFKNIPRDCPSISLNMFLVVFVHKNLLCTNNFPSNEILATASREVSLQTWCANEMSCFLNSKNLLC
uniref:Uncharacterized protein n=1 Tax=Pararge aegeria TaxID=116150 RepID=S4PKN0_9NEOP